MSAVVGGHRSLALFLLLPFLIIVAQNVLHGLIQCKHQTEDTRQEQNLQQDACIVVTLYVLHGLIQCKHQTEDTRQEQNLQQDICIVVTSHVLHGLIQSKHQTLSTGTESATRCMHHCNIANTRENMLDRNVICNKTHTSL